MGKKSNPEKAATILAEFASGVSVRPGGWNRVSSDAAKRVFYYDSSAQRIAKISEIIKDTGLLSRLTFVNVSQKSSAELAENLLKTVPEVTRQEIHVFCLDNCLIDVGARYRVRNLETGQVFRDVSNDEYFSKPDAQYWVDLTIKEYPGSWKRALQEQLEWDDRDFSNPGRVQQQIQLGRHGNRMFRKGVNR